jgi:hypothetical protein
MRFGAAFAAAEEPCQSCGMGKWNGLLHAGLALAWACSGDASSSTRPLCAGCVALLSPVESEDDGVNPLIGDPAPCSVSRTDVGRDFEGFGLSAASAVQLVEQRTSSPGRFRPTLYPLIWIGANQVSGHDAAPQVDVAVEVTRVTLSEREGPATCPARTLELRARVSVSTSDGALSGSFEDARVTFYGDAQALIQGGADAATFTGSLDFGRDRHPFQSLAASLYLTLAPGSVRGDLDFSVVTDDGGGGALALEWPVDACTPREQPVPGEAFLPLLEATRQTFAQSHPIPARWAAAENYPGGQHDTARSTGPFTALALELDGPVRANCRTLHGVEGNRASYVVDTDARLATDDGRIDGSLPGQLLVETDESGELVHATFSSERQFAAADLETAFGIQGVDMLGSACGVLSFSDVADIEDGETSGSLEITARSCSDSSEPVRLTEFLSWCSGRCSNGAPTPWFDRAGIARPIDELAPMTNPLQ